MPKMVCLGQDHPDFKKAPALGFWRLQHIASASRAGASNLKYSQTQ